MHERSRDKPVRVEETKIDVMNITQPQCAVAIEEALKGNPHVVDAAVSFIAGQAVIVYDANSISHEGLVGIIEDAKYECSGQDRGIITPFATGIGDESYYKKLGYQGLETVAPAWQSEYGLESDHAAYVPAMVAVLRNAFIIALLVTIAIVVTSPTGQAALGYSIEPLIERDIIHFILITPAIFYGGAFFFTAAWRALRQRTTNMSVLVSIGVLALYLYSAVATFILNGETLYVTASVVLTLILLGNLVEIALRRRMVGMTQSLFKMAPSKVRIIEDGEIQEIHIKYLRPGDIAVVDSGESVPADGVIIDGQAVIDQSDIIGESPPSVKVIGDRVIGSTINREGLFKMRVTSTGADALLARVLRIIEKAQRSRATVQETLDAAAFYLVPTIIVAAAGAFLFWRYVAGQGMVFALLVAVAAVIIACPDAIALAAPSVVTASIGIGVRDGILIKGALPMEKASVVDLIIFEKTGALTEGRPKLTDVKHVGELTEPGLLRLAAGLERESGHIIARSIVKAVEEQVGRGLPTPDSFKEIPGHGVTGEVETRFVIVGNRELMINNGIDITPVGETAMDYAEQGKTVVYIAVDERIEGVLGITDPIRPESRWAVDRIRDEGIVVALVTGDDVETANTIALKVGINNVFSGVSRAAKSEIIKDFQEKGFFVGTVVSNVGEMSLLDQADLGIVIGAGSDIVIEPGEIAIMDNNPRSLVDFITLSKLAADKIEQNIVWGVIYNAIAILLALGLLYPGFRLLVRPELGAIAVSIAIIVVTMNSLRVGRKFRRLRTRGLS